MGLGQIVAIITLVATGLSAFNGHDRRIDQNAAAIHAQVAAAKESRARFEGELNRLRAEANRDRAEIRESLQRLNDKMDEINRFLRDNGRPSGER